MKTYNTQYGIGSSRYIVNFHDGKKTHNDGSPFFDIQIFTNKRKLALFTSTLEKQGYKQHETTI